MPMSAIRKPPPPPPVTTSAQFDFHTATQRLRGTYTNAELTGYTSELDYLTAKLNEAAVAATEGRLRDQQPQRSSSAYNNNYADYGCAEVQPLADAGALPPSLMTATSNLRRHRPGDPLVLPGGGGGSGGGADDERPDGRHQHQQQQIDNISYSYCDNRTTRPDGEQAAAAERAALELGEMAQVQTTRMAQQRRMEQRLVSGRVTQHFTNIL